MLTPTLQQAIAEEIGYTFPKNTRFYNAEKLTVADENGVLSVGVRGKRDILRAALIAKANSSCKNYEIVEKGDFEDVCFMNDCSRNSVPTVATNKKLFRNLAMLGYNSCMFYMEDVYEVENEPYFGYLRGRYTKAEMKEMSAYADELGIELIPCIQTLAHFPCLKRWPEYKPHFDCQDILLVGDERVYVLLDNIFKTLSECFTTRRIHIGMDEAWMLGLGQYLDKNGYKDRFEIFLSHLERVNGIARKYGYESCIMWSDMFAWIAKKLGKTDKQGELVIPQEVIARIPENVELCHWKYHGTTKADYEAGMKLHDSFKNPIWYAGGTVSWGSFLPYNTYDAISSAASLQVAKEHGVKSVIQTKWGDDGAEAPLFCVLPGLAAFAYHANGVPMYAMNAEFKALTGYTVEAFNAVEDLNTWSGERTHDFAKNTKVGLYNDVFLGIADPAIIGEQVKKFAPAVEKLEKMRGVGQYGYLFDTAYALGKVLEIKYDMGIRLRKAYQAGNKAALLRICGEMRVLIQRMDAFLQAYRKQWLTEMKPFGLEVHELRLGGAKERLRSCMTRLEEYLAGHVEKIDELEGTPLPPRGAPYPDGRVGMIGFDEATSAGYQRFPFLT